MTINILFSSLLLVPAVISLKCMHNIGVSDILYYPNGEPSGSSTNTIPMGVLTCNAGLDRCVNFASMKVTDYMKLDVATKNPDFTSYIKDHNGNVYGRACMSQNDCDTLKAQKADICEGTGGGVTSCYCTTDECTGKGVAGLSIALPILASLTYYVSL